MQSKILGRKFIENFKISLLGKILNLTKRACIWKGKINNKGWIIYLVLEIPMMVDDLLVTTYL